MKRRLALLALSFLVPIPSFALSSDCQGKVLFGEEFKKADPAWQLDKDTTVGDGKLTIKVAPDVVVTSQYQGDAFPDGIQICGTLKLVSAALPSDSKDFHYAGIIFWARDYQSYYMLLVSDVGKFTVARRLTSDRQISPIPWQESAAINKGVGQINALRVILKGNQALLYINGKEVGKVSGQTPEGGNLVGFWAVAATKSGCTWELSNFVVSIPAAETQATPVA